MENCCLENNLNYSDKTNSNYNQCDQSTTNNYIENNGYNTVY
jgi:hypothetical protein